MELTSKSVVPSSGPGLNRNWTGRELSLVYSSLNKYFFPLCFLLVFFIVFYKEQSNNLEYLNTNNCKVSLYHTGNTVLTLETLGDNYSEMFNKFLTFTPLWVKGGGGGGGLRWIPVEDFVFNDSHKLMVTLHMFINRSHLSNTFFFYIDMLSTVQKLKNQ